MGDRMYTGVLEGRRNLGGVDFVTIKRPGSHVLVSPDMCPSEEWIRQNTGKWVQVVAQENRVIEVREGVDPKQYMKDHAEAQRIAVTCTICHETVCYAPPPDTVSPEEAKKALAPFITHMQKRHPEAAGEILESL